MSEVEMVQAVPEDQFQRTRQLLGSEEVDRLQNASVLLFGVGGVGGFTCEALARAGVGRIHIVDKDVVDITNINRQIIATHDTVGRSKVEVMKERIADIDPDCVVRTYEMLYLPETADQFDFTQYDYVVDAIDTVTGKLELVEQAVKAGVPIISSMGAGNKLDPSQFRVSDLYKTSVDPLARVMRTELRKRGVKHLKCVWSPEIPITPKGVVEDAAPGKRIPGSVAFVPSVAGLILAGEVVRDLAGIE